MSFLIQVFIILVNFLNSNFFQSLTTGLVVFVAIYVYKQQKNDSKKDAANSILLEVQNAERVIQKIKDSVKKDSLEVDVSVLQSNSWSKHKHLFSRDFDGDEWDLLDNFYNKAALLDDAIRYNNSAFANDVEAIRSNKQRVLADYVVELLEKNKNGTDPKALIEDFESRAKLFDQIYMDKQGEYMYKPVKPVNDAKLYLEDLPKITTSTVGLKLKQLAGIQKK